MIVNYRQPASPSIPFMGKRKLPPLICREFTASGAQSRFESPHPGRKEILAEYI